MKRANYEEAARTYQHLVGLGYEDATLYYNLANAYYKSEDMGRAILNYLRARRLAPFDRGHRGEPVIRAAQRSDAPNLGTGHDAGVRPDSGVPTLDNVQPVGDCRALGVAAARSAGRALSLRRGDSADQWR